MLPSDSIPLALLCCAIKRLSSLPSFFLPSIIKMQS